MLSWNDEITGVGFRCPVALDDDTRDRCAGRVRLELDRLRVRQQRDVVVLERRSHAQDLRVGLGVHRTRKPVAVAAAHTRAVGHVRLVEQDSAGGVEGVVACVGQLVGELLDPRLVRHSGMRVRRTGRRLRRVLASRSVNLVDLLGLRVVRLEVVVRDRPGRRDAVVVAKLAEVLCAQPVEGGTVELRGPADVVVDLRLERFAVRVVPGVVRDVAVLHEHGLREPVLRLAR
jgi:hypothetical protein